MTTKLPLPEGVSFDIETSTIIIAGCRFPVGVVSSIVPGKFWGGVYAAGNGWSVSIPMENGVLLGVSLDLSSKDGRPVMSLHLECPFWVRPWKNTEDELGHAAIVNGRIVTTGPGMLKGAAIWEDAEAEWAAEHIMRLGTLPFDMPSGLPRVEILPLSRVPEFVEQVAL